MPHRLLVLLAADFFFLFLFRACSRSEAATDFIFFGVERFLRMLPALLATFFDVAIFNLLQGSLPRFSSPGQQMRNSRIPPSKHQNCYNGVCYRIHLNLSHADLLPIEQLLLKYCLDFSRFCGTSVPFSYRYPS